MSGIPQIDIPTKTLTASGATTTRFSYKGARGGGFRVVSLATAVSVTFQVANTLGGTLGDLKDSNNAAISQTLTAGDSYEIPTQAFAFAEIALVCNAGTAVVDVCFKG